MIVLFYLLLAMLAVIVAYILSRPLLRCYDEQTNTYHGRLSRWWFVLTMIFVLLFSSSLYCYVTDKATAPLSQVTKYNNQTIGSKAQQQDST